MSLTSCKLTDSWTPILCLIAISRSSADVVNYTNVFYKCVCHLRSFRNTGPHDSPITSGIHWHLHAASNYNNLCFLYLFLRMCPQKFNRPVALDYRRTYVNHRPRAGSLGGPSRRDVLGQVTRPYLQLIGPHYMARLEGGQTSEALSYVTGCIGVLRRYLRSCRGCLLPK